MCRPARCDQCGKTTWAGCGEHIDEVRSAVPASQWCDGHPDPVTETDTSAEAGWWRRLLRR